MPDRRTCRCRKLRIRINHIVSIERLRSLKHRLARSRRRVESLEKGDTVLAHDEYLVEAILCHKWIAGRPWLCIKWHGYSGTTWEPCCNISYNLLSMYARSNQTTDMELDFYKRQFPRLITKLWISIALSYNFFFFTLLGFETIVRIKQSGTEQKITFS